MDRPATSYARSGELAIAYQIHGSGDPDLLVNTGTASNVEAAWYLPEAAQLFERLGRFARVIRYDRRDTGLSDPIRDDLTLEAHAADALAVMDAAGARRPVLMGSVDGSRSLALLAATRPDRVGGLIAIAPSVRGAAAASPEFAQEAARALTQLDDYPGHAMIAAYAPRWAADPVRRDRLARYFQASASPRRGARLLRMSLTSDVGQALSAVQTPTLVLHPQDLQMISSEQSRQFAELIPDAQFREIPGDCAMPFGLDIGLIGDVVERFVTGAAPAPVTDRMLATVLFTDLVESTTRAASAGDRAWSGTLERHFADTRVAVDEHGGQLVKTTGDGVLAIFTGPAQGVRCAQRIISHARSLDLDLRSGLHTGEVERTPEDVTGLAVHLAARIMSRADAGEILVSRTVRDLVIGSELSFTDRGEHELKGIPDRWALYAAS